jgi:hypothetical protein
MMHYSSDISGPSSTTSIRLDPINSRHIPANRKQRGAKDSSAATARIMSGRDRQRPMLVGVFESDQAADERRS